jgi:hypothetical protein
MNSPVIVDPPLPDKRATDNTAERVEMQRRESWSIFLPGLLLFAGALVAAVLIASLAMSVDPTPSAITSQK